MPTKTPSPSWKTKSLWASLALMGQRFDFRLLTRSVVLGEAATIQYYWMDSSQFRNLNSDPARANFRSIIGFWHAGMRAQGVADQLDQQIHLVLATSYFLASRCKALQHIYRDAYLAPRFAEFASDSLRQSALESIRDAVQSRDRLRVQQELANALGGFRPPQGVMPLMQESFRHWVGTGVTLLRTKGTEGLVEYLGRADYWLKKLRKRSTVWVRHFLNMFLYECKVTFYTCYANAWVGLIPWLQEHRDLDPISTRFLRFWHNQNQPIELQPGRTAGGVLYPTQRGIVFDEDNGRGGTCRRSMTVMLSRPGPAHLGDVFRGQILSLHPLSGFFMKDAALCAVAGRFFATDAYDLALHRGGAYLCAEYWDLHGAILTSAHLYRQALARQEQGRNGRRLSTSIEHTAAPSTVEGEALLLEDFAVDQRLRCPHCAGALRQPIYHPARPSSSEAAIDYTCCRCAHPLTITVRQDELVSYLLGNT